MENKFERKVNAKEEQLKDRVQIAEGKTKLAGHQAKEKLQDWQDDISSNLNRTIDNVKEKGTEFSDRTKERIQREEDRLRDRR